MWFTLFGGLESLLRNAKVVASWPKLSGAERIDVSVDTFRMAVIITGVGLGGCW